MWPLTEMTHSFFLSFYFLFFFILTFFWKKLPVPSSPCRSQWTSFIDGANFIFSVTFNIYLFCSILPQQTHWLPVQDENTTAQCSSLSCVWIPESRVAVGFFFHFCLSKVVILMREKTFEMPWQDVPLHFQDHHLVSFHVPGVAFETETAANF